MMQTRSPRLLIVDHDGKILHHLMWDAGQYVVADERAEESLGSQETQDNFSPVASTPEVASAQTAPATSSIHLAAAEAIVQELKHAYEPLQDAIIVAATGTVLAATSDTASTTMCEVVTALMEFGLQATQALDMGEMTQIASRDEQILSILYPATHGAALAVTTASNGNLGLLYRSCQRALQHLAAQL